MPYKNMLRQYTKLDHYPELAADPRLSVHLGELFHSRPQAYMYASRF